MNAGENQIVVYQPNETVRLDVRLENETVWLTQAQLCALFGVVKSNVSYHLKNIFGTNELDYGAKLVTHSNGELKESDFEAFAKQCGKSTKTICGICHDRFSSSLTARKCFGLVA